MKVVVGLRTDVGVVAIVVVVVVVGTAVDVVAATIVIVVVTTRLVVVGRAVVVRNCGGMITHEDVSDMRLLEHLPGCSPVQHHGPVQVGSGHGLHPR